MSDIFLPLIMFSQAEIISKGFRFRILEEKPTAIPDDPLIKIVGMIGRKYLGSISTPSSSLYSNNSKSL